VSYEWEENQHSFDSVFNSIKDLSPNNFNFIERIADLWDLSIDLPAGNPRIKRLAAITATIPINSLHLYLPSELDDILNQISLYSQSTNIQNLTGELAAFVMNLHDFILSTPESETNYDYTELVLTAARITTEFYWIKRLDDTIQALKQVLAGLDFYPEDTKEHQVEEANQLLSSLFEMKCTVLAQTEQQISRRLGS